MSTRQRGSTLIEVLVAIALTAVMLPALATALITAKAGRPTTERQIQASSLLREGTEAVRSVHEKGWSNVTTNGTYHPTITGSSWSLNSGSETLGAFSRQVVISSVQRNAAGAIVTSGGTVDPNTNQVVVTVSWTIPYANSVSSTSYLSRWQANSLWTQTSQADFSGGTHTNTCAVATNCNVNFNFQNDAVQLQDSPATWPTPTEIGSYNVTGNVSGLSVSAATIGGIRYAFVGYSGGLAVINVNNPAAPTLADSIAVGGAVNGVAVSGTTAYLATAANSGEIVTVNVSNPTNITQSDSLNLGDTGDALTIFVSGTYAYVGKVAAGILNQEFFIVNVTNPANITQTGTLARQNAAINGIYVSGNYAYLATNKANQQLITVNVTNKSSPSVADTLNASVIGYDVAVNGTTAYLGTANNGSSGELRAVNVTDPANISFSGSYEVGGQVTGVDIDLTNANYLMLSTAVATRQGILLNVSTPSSPTLLNNLNLGSTANRVYIHTSYAFFGTANTAKELIIYYAGHRTTGTFESSTFDAGSNVGFNRLLFTGTVPASSTLRLQIATNNTGSGWTYLGPDGTAGTYYTVSGPIHLTLASARYARYRAYFTPTANGQQSPILQDVSLNYSP